MKKIMVLLIAMTAVGSASAQIQDFYSTTYFHTNVYLSDNTNVSIQARIPTGNLMRVQTDNVIAPSGNLIVDGGFELRTNRLVTMLYKPAVDAMQTGVVINANGYITLNHFVTGVGWTNKVLNPTNLVLRNETFTETDPIYTSAVATNMHILSSLNVASNIICGDFSGSLFRFGFFNGQETLLSNSAVFGRRAGGNNASGDGCFYFCYRAGYGSLGDGNIGIEIGRAHV